MKVLVPIPFDLSQLAHGRNLRVVHLLGELSGRCALTCLTPNRTLAAAAGRMLPQTRIEAAGLEAASKDVEYAAIPSRTLRRALAYFGYDRGLLKEVYQRAGDYDAVLGFDVPCVAYLLAAARVGGPRPRIICDLIDDPWLSCRALPVARRYSFSGLKAALAVQIIRRRALGQFDALVAVAPFDADRLSSAVGREVLVVPNGVHVADDSRIRAGAPLAVFSGAMDYPPNEAAAVYFVRQIWPKVLQRVSALEVGGTGQPASARSSVVQSLAVRCALVGANPTAKVRRLAEAPGVEVTGYVEDLSAWLRRARVAVAPMVSGSGIKNKVLQACAAGCPVVCTPLGSAGLPVGAEHGILRAGATAQFAELVAALLRDPAKAAGIGAAGRRMVRQRFSWSQAADLLMAVLAGQTGRSAAAAGQAGGANVEALAHAPA